MILEEFNKLSDEQKREFLREVDITDIVNKYPTTYDDLLIFVQWQSEIGMFGDDLKYYLYRCKKIMSKLGVNI